MAAASYFDGFCAEPVLRLGSVAEIIDAVPFGSERFLDLVNAGAFDLPCRHAARVSEDEGAGDVPLVAFSAYGLSKGLTAAVVGHRCREAGLRYAKFVIPNPFGPLGGAALLRLPDGAGRKGSAKLNPSGYVESRGAFAERFAAAMRPSLGLGCGLEVATQTDFSEAVMRVNTDCAARYVGEWDEGRA
jgi:hypothetical protein